MRFLTPLEIGSLVEKTLAMAFLSHLATRRRAAGRSARRVNRRLTVEPLESRRLLDAEGLAWSDAPDLTISFAPDGTEVGPYTSALYASLESVGAENVWQDKLLDAFQLWADHANASVRAVGDSGAALGAMGLKQADPRFGDVRIAAVPLPDDVIAVSVPNDTVVSGTWSGDVLFNSNVELATLDDVYAVAVHEAGHVFGLGHSTDPLSPMFTHGIPDSVIPTTGDILDLQALYGVPLSERDGGGSGSDDDHTDEHETEEHANDVLINAAPITITPFFSGAVRYDGSGTITSPDDIDYFQLTPTAEQFEPFDVMTVTVRSVGTDRLAPQIDVFNHEGELRSADVLVSGDGEYIVQLTGADPDDTYFLRVQADPLEPDYASGAYEFTARFGQQATVIETLQEGRLKPEATRVEDTLNVPESGLVHLVLSVKELDAPSDAVVWAAIYDTDEQVVYQVAARPGQTRSAASTLLDAGVYHIEVTAESPTGADIPEIKFDLLGAVTTIPIGPGVTDPTGTPILPCGSVGADPTLCLPPTLVIGDPVVLPSPLPAPPAPVVRVDPPWLVPGLWYWNAADASATHVQAANAWHNGNRPTDVNSDGLTTPIDALMIINHINTSNSTVLPSHPPTEPLIDVTNDGFITPLDALQVVNRLNQPPGGGEGEAAGLTMAAVAPIHRRPTKSSFSEGSLFAIDASSLSALRPLDGLRSEQASSDAGTTNGSLDRPSDEAWARWAWLRGLDY